MVHFLKIFFRLWQSLNCMQRAEAFARPASTRKSQVRMHRCQTDLGIHCSHIPKDTCMQDAPFLCIMVHVLKSWIPKCLTKCRMQTVQTQIRLLIRIYTVYHSTKYFKKRLHKKQTLGQNTPQPLCNIIVGVQSINRVSYATMLYSNKNV